MDKKEFKYAILKLSQGDVLVIKTDHLPTAEQVEELKAALPHHNHIMFIHGNVEISVLKAEDHG